MQRQGRRSTTIIAYEVQRNRHILGTRHRQVGRDDTSAQGHRNSGLRGQRYRALKLLSNLKMWGGWRIKRIHYRKNGRARQKVNIVETSLKPRNRHMQIDGQIHITVACKTFGIGGKSAHSVNTSSIPGRPMTSAKQSTVARQGDRKQHTCRLD